MTDAETVAAVADRIGDVRQRLLVLDFDGTLAPIVERPDDAALAPGATEAITALCRVAEIAVLTGRPVDDVAPRLGDLPVTICGGHGTEVRLPDGSRTALFDTESAGDTLRTAERELRELVDEDAGWEVEPKPASIAIHHRRVPEAQRDALLPQVRRVLADHQDDPPGWELLDGHAVTELRPAGVDKGTALAWLVERTPGRPPVVLGDDVTDEDAFREAERHDGFGVLVAEEPRETAAVARIATPRDVVELLEQLAGGTG